MDKTAAKLLATELKCFLDLLGSNFNKGFAKIIKWYGYSLYTYYSEIAGWSLEKINHVEVMGSATNQFQNSFPELVIESMDFSGAKWKTIEGGLDHRSAPMWSLSLN